MRHHPPRPTAAIRLTLAVAVLSALNGCGSGGESEDARGEAVYQANCAGCHNSIESHAPMIGSLRQMPAERILRAMDFGVMMSVTYALDRSEREAVAHWLGTEEPLQGPQESAFCSDQTVAVSPLPGAGRNAADGEWNGWSPAQSNNRYQAEPGFTLADLPRLRLKWAYGFDGDTNSFAPPAVLGPNVFVGSASGIVQALDRDSGCVKWIYQASGPVRSAMLVAPLGEFDAEGLDTYAVLFGDQIGWFYAVNAATGAELWKLKPEPHESTKLTGTPVVHEGIVYVPVASWEESRPLNPGYVCCSFRGSVAALNISDGSKLWQSFLVEEEPQPMEPFDNGRARVGPSGAGTWSAPTLDLERGRIYVTTGNNYTGLTRASDAIVALDLANGAIEWVQQVTPDDEFNLICSRAQNCPGPDADFGSSAILARDASGRQVLLAGQKSGVVFGLDPDNNGKILWQTRVGQGGVNGGVQWGMAADAANVYASVSDVGRIAAQDKSAFDPSPNAVDPSTGGGLSALRISDGERVWFAEPAPCPATQAVCSPAQPAALTAIPGAVFSGSVDGHLRAFSTIDGSVLWDVDTAREWETVNGIAARGGSIDGAGPVVAGGMVFTHSGYSRNGGMPGNVLLAWGIE